MLNHYLRNSCTLDDAGDYVNTLTVNNIHWWLRKFTVAEELLIYATMLKICIGLVQMAQLAELQIKLNIILEQSDISQFETNKKKIFLVLLTCIVFTFPVLIWPYADLTKSLNALNDNSDYQQQYENFKVNHYDGLRVFGIISGCEFLLLSIGMFVQFWHVFNLIESSKGNALSSSLQAQKYGLKRMLIVCILSYFVAGWINMFYGRYGSYGLDWF